MYIFLSLSRNDTFFSYIISYLLLPLTYSSLHSNIYFVLDENENLLGISSETRKMYAKEKQHFFSTFVCFSSYRKLSISLPSKGIRFSLFIFIFSILFDSKCLWRETCKLLMVQSTLYSVSGTHSTQHRARIWEEKKLRQSRFHFMYSRKTKNKKQKNEKKITTNWQLCANTYETIPKRVNWKKI